MKKINFLFMAMLAILMLPNASVIAQVDPSVEVIIIDGGNENIGMLEFIINNDVDGDGNRLNPNRVYMLKKDQVYIQQASIQFNDTEATLRIVGEEGGNMPMVLMQPLEGVDQFTNSVSGDLSINNVYWPAMNLNQLGGTLFNLNGATARLELENFVTENARGDVFGLRDVLGYANVYIKNSYFRDLSQLSNSWNYVIFARGNNGEPFDTLWIENTTITNGGMPLFGKGTVTNFFYLNHNTFVNSTKYPIWMERFAEAYITNNLFINANWEGECEATWGTQIGEDFIPSGQIRFDTIEAEFWAGAPDPAPAQEDVKILASNNLNFFSPLLNPYYAGAYNDVGDKPISNRTWGVVADEDIPTLVSNLPVKMFSDRELQLVADWPLIKEDHNYDLDTDPEMVTKGVRDASAAQQFAYFARNNYAVADAGEDWDRTQIWFGDGDALTIPGSGTENGGGFPDVTGLPEDFSYTNDALYSLIDGHPLGALSWWPANLAIWDSEAALADVMQYHVDGIATDKLNVGIFDNKSGSENAIGLYPNPVNDILNIVGKSELNNANLYDITGKLVMTIELNGVLSTELNVAELDKGIYLLQVMSVKGEISSQKFVKE